MFVTYLIVAPTPVPCEPENPCQNGGVCHDNGNGGHTCDCPEGYTGDDCEIRELLQLLSYISKRLWHGFLKSCVTLTGYMMHHAHALRHKEERANIFSLNQKAKSAEPRDEMRKNSIHFTLAVFYLFYFIYFNSIQYPVY